MNSILKWVGMGAQTWVDGRGKEVCVYVCVYPPKRGGVRAIRFIPSLDLCPFLWITLPQILHAHPHISPISVSEKQCVCVCQVPICHIVLFHYCSNFKQLTITVSLTYQAITMMVIWAVGSFYRETTLLCSAIYILRLKKASQITAVSEYSATHHICKKLGFL